MSEELPAGQITQVFPPLAYIPALQGVQLEAPAADIIPEGQFGQYLDNGVDRLKKVPGGH